jgi:hypothetical protein
LEDLVEVLRETVHAQQVHDAEIVARDAPGLHDQTLDRAEALKALFCDQVQELEPLLP